MTAERRLDLRAAPGIVEIELPESPTTGFLWRLVDPPPGVSEVDRAYRDQSGPGRVGGSGTRVFRLSAPTPGRYELEFRLQRPWEADARERALAVLEVTTAEPA